MQAGSIRSEAVATRESKPLTDDGETHTVELRSDQQRVELRLTVVEDHHHHIVAEMAFAFQLLFVVRSVRQECRNMEHDFEVFVCCIHRF
jgi:hypothetical protein